MFRGNKTKLIPLPLSPDVVGSEATDLNDDGTALVISYDANYNFNHWLYKKNKLTKLNFGSTISSAFAFDINNEGIVVGEGRNNITGDEIEFRHDPSTGKTMTLNPLPTANNSMIRGINNRGNILGALYNYYRYFHIGLYDKKGIFHTYVVEGTPEFPHSSYPWPATNFNDKDLIVISYYDSDRTSYLLPKPGVALDLADLITNLPVGRHPSYIADINNEGDMLGFDVDYDFNVLDKFLLKRIDATSP
ncbi:MAG: DUF3466 family protein [Methyloglobulus sp.]|nr:DUF3466 family protein [Methyloglobulus sp.]